MYGREALAHQQAAALLAEVGAMIDGADDDVMRVIDGMIKENRAANVVKLAQPQRSLDALDWERMMTGARLSIHARDAQSHNQGMGGGACRGLFGGVLG